jgi:excisionase family DNA binding protein
VDGGVPYSASCHTRVRPVDPAWRIHDQMAVEPRFLTLSDVAEVLSISTSQAYALVRNKELEAIKVGGRGQWRVERDKLEEYIQRMYAETRQFIASHPFVDED